MFRLSALYEQIQPDLGALCFEFECNAVSNTSGQTCRYDFTLLTPSERDTKCTAVPSQRRSREHSEKPLPEFSSTGVPFRADEGLEDPSATIDESDFFDLTCSGQHIDTALMDLLWDDYGLTMPSLF